MNVKKIVCQIIGRATAGSAGPVSTPVSNQCCPSLSHYACANAEVKARGPIRLGPVSGPYMAPSKNGQRAPYHVNCHTTVGTSRTRICQQIEVISTLRSICDRQTQTDRHGAIATASCTNRTIKQAVHLTAGRQETIVCQKLQ